MRLMRLMLALLVFATLATTAPAGPLRRRTVLRHRAATYTLNTPLGPVSRTTERTTIRGPGVTVDALAEVNAKRAARGLRAFVADPALTEAAKAAAAFRAANRIQGHTSNDFAFLPPGSAAHAAGCAAMEASWGFLSCCQWEGWTFAGAASVTGTDGRVYHHLFVRN